MAAITAALIKQVREDTGAGMLDVKKALTEAEGDVARAKEIIRAKGIAAAGKREGRKAQEGTIASKVVETANGETGYAVELNSETDFVAKTPKFVEFTEEVLATPWTPTPTPLTSCSRPRLATPPSSWLSKRPPPCSVSTSRSASSPRSPASTSKSTLTRSPPRCRRASSP